MIKVFAYKDRLHKTPKLDCSWPACTRQPDWSCLYDGDNTKRNRAFCTTHALEFVKNNNVALRDIPMALAEHMGDAPKAPRRSYTPPRRFHLETWLNEGRHGMTTLEQEIADTEAQLAALMSRKAVLNSILSAIPEELQRQLDEAIAAAVEERFTAANDA